MGFMMIFSYMYIMCFSDTHTSHATLLFLSDSHLVPSVFFALAFYNVCSILYYWFSRSQERQQHDEQNATQLYTAYFIVNSAIETGQ